MSECHEAVRDHILAQRGKTDGERQAFNEGCWAAFYAMWAYIDDLPDQHPAKAELARAAEQAKQARLPVPRRER